MRIALWFMACWIFGTLLGYSLILNYSSICYVADGIQHSFYLGLLSDRRSEPVPPW